MLSRLSVVDWATLDTPPLALATSLNATRNVSTPPSSRQNCRYPAANSGSRRSSDKISLNSFSLIGSSELAFLLILHYESMSLRQLQAPVCRVDASWLVRYTGTTGD